jgi:hypothetical protein
MMISNRRALRKGVARGGDLLPMLATDRRGEGLLMSCIYR